MKYFFQDYLAMPLSILLFLIIAPTVLYGGVKLAITLFGVAPACEVRE
jgi:hypothetical protein